MADYTTNMPGQESDEAAKARNLAEPVPGYVITTRYPDILRYAEDGTAGLRDPDIEYMPRKLCIELKALKMYLLAYRSLGIFYENAVNKILEDIVAAIQPEWCTIRGSSRREAG